MYFGYFKDNLFVLKTDFIIIIQSEISVTFFSIWTGILEQMFCHLKTEFFL